MLAIFFAGDFTSSNPSHIGVAAAILSGLLISTWFTYLAGLLFTRARQPLLWANLLFGIAAIAVLSWSRWKHKVIRRANGESHNTFVAGTYLPRPKGSSIADWLLIAGYVVLVSWMMFASFNSSDGSLRISNAEYSDFGPNTAIMQSFAVGHNFPTEYPHFSGDRIRYHFLFYFQAGNLEFLGLNPVWSLNLLSIATLVAMLVLAMTLGEVVFNSRAVGRLGSLLFFFFGSLSLRSLPSQTRFGPRCDSSHQATARFSPKHLSLSRGNVGYLVSSHISQPAAFCQRDRDTAARADFSGHPLPHATEAS